MTTDPAPGPHARESPPAQQAPRRGGARQLVEAGAAVSGAGAALVATAATACCAGPIAAPLIVGILGASGAAWAAGLKPYSPWLLGGSFLMLAFGFRSAYRRPARCDTSGHRRSSMSAKAVRGVLWLAAALWIAAVFVNFRFGS